jgi:uncharacterized RDD family membrane protein YckC
VTCSSTSGASWVRARSIVVGLLAGGGYSERGDGYARAGVNVAGNAVWLWLGLALGYYVLCEAATGMTLGKRMVGMRVVDEDRDLVGLGAAVVRNVLRVVDGLFFYLVGALFAPRHRAASGSATARRTLSSSAAKPPKRFLLPD